MWREKNIYFTEHDIYFTKLMFILKNINLELKSALRTKYIFYRFLLYISLSEASVMVNVTKGILVECDPAMKQVLLSIHRDFHPIGYISVSSAP